MGCMFQPNEMLKNGARLKQEHVRGAGPAATLLS